MIIYLFSNKILGIFFAATMQANGVTDVYYCYSNRLWWNLEGGGARRTRDAEISLPKVCSNADG